MVMDTEFIVDRGHRAGREVTQPQLVTVDGSLNRERVHIFLPSEQKVVSPLYPRHSPVLGSRCGISE